MGHLRNFRSLGLHFYRSFKEEFLERSNGAINLLATFLQGEEVKSRQFIFLFKSLNLGGNLIGIPLNQLKRRIGLFHHLTTDINLIPQQFQLLGILLDLDLHFSMQRFRFLLVLSVSFFVLLGFFCLLGELCLELLLLLF
jgi:hypothetical protein